ncbi:MAG: type II secretion system protein [Lentisphaeria bacterium]|nr:type II secretion system protein [Lentisphaeria bacterium]
MKICKVKRFTLIELLAAMAVFSILLMLSLRLFSGSQQLWLRSEQKTDTFASARTAMEYMASRMQTLTYIEDTDENKWYPFEITDNSIWFISTMAMADGDSQRRFLKFRLVDPKGSSDYAGFLQMIKYDGHQQKRKGFFGELFPSYGESRRKKYVTTDDDGNETVEVVERKIKSYEDAMKHLEKLFEKFDSNDFKDNPVVDGARTNAVAIDICENVIGLKFTRFVAEEDPDDPDNADKNKLNAQAKTGKTNDAPYLVEIELKMLDSRESFLKWKEAGDTEKKRIFLEHGYTFSRAVLLGKKGSK